MHQRMDPSGQSSFARIGPTNSQDQKYYQTQSYLPPYSSINSFLSSAGNDSSMSSFEENFYHRASGEIEFHQSMKASEKEKIKSESEQEILKHIRLTDYFALLDTLTVSEELVQDADHFLKLMQLSTNNQAFSSPSQFATPTSSNTTFLLSSAITTISGSTGGGGNNPVIVIEKPNWFKPNSFHSFATWIIVALEENLWAHYNYDNNTNLGSMKANDLTNLFREKTDMGTQDVDLQQLSQFWRDTSEKDKKTLIDQFKAIVTKEAESEFNSNHSGHSRSQKSYHSKQMHYQVHIKEKGEKQSFQEQVEYELKSLLEFALRIGSESELLMSLMYTTFDRSPQRQVNLNRKFLDLIKKKFKDDLMENLLQEEYQTTKTSKTFKKKKKRGNFNSNNANQTPTIPTANNLSAISTDKGSSPSLFSENLASGSQNNQSNEDAIITTTTNTTEDVQKLKNKKKKGKQQQQQQPQTGGTKDHNEHVVHTTINSQASLHSQISNSQNHNRKKKKGNQNNSKNFRNSKENNQVSNQKDNSHSCDEQQPKIEDITLDKQEDDTLESDNKNSSLDTKSSSNLFELAHQSSNNSIRTSSLTLKSTSREEICISNQVQQQVPQHQLQTAKAQSSSEKVNSKEGNNDKSQNTASMLQQSKSVETQEKISTSTFNAPQKTFAEPPFKQQKKLESKNYQMMISSNEHRLSNSNNNNRKATIDSNLNNHDADETKSQKSTSDNATQGGNSSSFSNGNRMNKTITNTNVSHNAWAKGTAKQPDPSKSKKKNHLNQGKKQQQTQNVLDTNSSDQESNSIVVRKANNNSSHIDSKKQTKFNESASNAESSNVSVKDDTQSQNQANNKKKRNKKKSKLTDTDIMNNFMKSLHSQNDEVHFNSYSTNSSSTHGYHDKNNQQQQSSSSYQQSSYKKKTYNNDNSSNGGAASHRVNYPRLSNKNSYTVAVSNNITEANLESSNIQQQSTSLKGEQLGSSSSGEDQKSTVSFSSRGGDQTQPQQHQQQRQPYKQKQSSPQQQQYAQKNSQTTTTNTAASNSAYQSNVQHNNTTPRDSNPSQEVKESAIRNFEKMIHVEQETNDQHAQPLVNQSNLQALQQATHSSIYQVKKNSNGTPSSTLNSSKPYNMSSASKNQNQSSSFQKQRSADQTVSSVNQSAPVQNSQLTVDGATQVTSSATGVDDKDSVNSNGANKKGPNATNSAVADQFSDDKSSKSQKPPSHSEFHPNSRTGPFRQLNFQTTTVMHESENNSFTDLTAITNTAADTSLENNPLNLQSQSKYQSYQNTPSKGMSHHAKNYHKQHTNQSLQGTHDQDNTANFRTPPQLSKKQSTQSSYSNHAGMGAGNYSRKTHTHSNHHHNNNQHHVNHTTANGYVANNMGSANPSNNLGVNSMADNIFLNPNGVNNPGMNGFLNGGQMNGIMTPINNTILGDPNLNLNNNSFTQGVGHHHSNGNKSNQRAQGGQQYRRNTTASQVTTGGNPNAQPSNNSNNVYVQPMNLSQSMQEQRQFMQAFMNPENNNIFYQDQNLMMNQNQIVDTLNKSQEGVFQYIEKNPAMMVQQPIPCYSPNPYHQTAPPMTPQYMTAPCQDLMGNPFGGYHPTMHQQHHLHSQQRMSVPYFDQSQDLIFQIFNSIKSNHSMSPIPQMISPPPLLDFQFPLGNDLSLQAQRADSYPSPLGFMLNQNSSLNSPGHPSKFPNGPQEQDFFYQQLDTEIEGFVNQIQENINQMKPERDYVYNKLANIANQVFAGQNPKLELFGSLITGLALESSDMDLAVTGLQIDDRFFMISELNKLAQALQDWQCLESFKSIETASIPVIKMKVDLVKLRQMEMPEKVEGDFLQRPVPEDQRYLSVDITFDDSPISPQGNVSNPFQSQDFLNPAGTKTHLGLQSCALVQHYIGQYRSLRHVAILLKKFLSVHGLNSPYYGGISSYSTVILVVAYMNYYQLKHHHDLTPSRLLIGFLEFYGHYFNPGSMGISVYDDGSFFQLNSLLDSNFVILDPLNLQNNTTRNSYHTKEILLKFQCAFSNLKNLMHKLATPTGKQQAVQISNIQTASSRANSQDQKQSIPSSFDHLQSSPQPSNFQTNACNIQVTSESQQYQQYANFEVEVESGKIPKAKRIQPEEISNEASNLESRAVKDSQINQRLNVQVSLLETFFAKDAQQTDVISGMSSGQTEPRGTQITMIEETQVQ